MASGDVGSASFLNKQMKMRGLQKLRFYCQICQKQCRDENGYKSHLKSASHLRRLSQITQKDIEQYTAQFEKDFLRLLRLMHGEKKVEANKFYNEFIQDKDHVHMNATKFTSLSRFIQYLGQKGSIRIHGLEKLAAEMDAGQLMISYLDTSSENVIRKTQIQAIKQGELSENEIQMKLLEKQIQKAQSETKEGSVDKLPMPLNSEPEMGPIKLTVTPSKVVKKKPKKKVNNVFRSKK